MLSCKAGEASTDECLSALSLRLIDLYLPYKEKAPAFAGASFLLTGSIDSGTIHIHIYKIFEYRIRYLVVPERSNCLRVRSRAGEYHDLSWLPYAPGAPNL